MSKNFKAYLKTPKGKLTAALSVLALVWLILLVNYAGGISSFLPNQLFLSKRFLQRGQVTVISPLPRGTRRRALQLGHLKYLCFRSAMRLKNPPMALKKGLNLAKIRKNH